MIIAKMKGFSNLLFLGAVKLWRYFCGAQLGQNQWGKVWGKKTKNVALQWQ
jgi:hypothetical protein